MQKEIELKYKINKIPPLQKEGMIINQYYFDFLKKQNSLIFLFQDLNFKEITEARIREIKQKEEIEFILTLKSGEVNSRTEYEKSIDKKTAINLLKNNIVGKVKKRRYEITLNNITFEFDEYLNSSKNLKTVEIELKELPTKIKIAEIEGMLKHIFKLKFKNVTNDKNFKNKNLAGKERENEF